ncbi:MAG: hypothetical protein QF706_10395 [Roseibacillus sp.]|jgi:hypothetical protein|nr:hypothetical protein [Roseibacillus sp.]
MAGAVFIDHPGGSVRIVAMARGLPGAEEQGDRSGQEEKNTDDSPADTAPVEEIERDGKKTDQGNGKKLGCSGGGDDQKANRSEPEGERGQGPGPGEDAAERT